MCENGHQCCRIPLPFKGCCRIIHRGQINLAHGIVTYHQHRTGLLQPTAVMPTAGSLAKPYSRCFHAPACAGKRLVTPVQLQLWPVISAAAVSPAWLLAKQILLLLAAPLLCQLELLAHSRASHAAPAIPHCQVRQLVRSCSIMTVEDKHEDKHV